MQLYLKVIFMTGLKLTAVSEPYWVIENWVDTLQAYECTGSPAK